MTAETELEFQTRAFRDWAIGKEGYFGEWECDYPDWPAIYAAVRPVLALPSFSDATVTNLHYLLARDNESEFIRAELESQPAAGLRLAHAALIASDPDARWQLAVLLGDWPHPEARELLRQYLEDAEEYVRRRALLAAVARDPEFAERAAWSRLGDPYEYARLAAFSVLRDLGSHRLPEAIRLLRDDPSEMVRQSVAEAAGRGSGY